MRPSGRSFRLLSAVLLSAFLLSALPAAGQTPDPPSAAPRFYLIHNANTRGDRTAIARAGALIIEVGHNYLLVEADPATAQSLRQLGYVLDGSPAVQAMMTPLGFPPADSDYHDYAEMVSEIDTVVAAHSAIVSKFSVGQSYEGRELWAVKISDNVNADEAEPEVLLTHGQHAREHLTIEQALYTLQLLTDNYGADEQITRLVDTREIYIFFNLNPDGSEYDIATGEYHWWRKNRQPSLTPSIAGTDLNRGAIRQDLAHIAGDGLRGLGRLTETKEAPHLSGHGHLSTLSHRRD